MKYLKLLTILTLLLPVFSYADFQVNLKYGAKGDEVRELQEFLISEGHLTGTATGNFYSLTVKAVKEFQRVNNLPVTGYFGSMSRDIANRILAIDADNTELQELGSITAPVDTTLDKKIEDLNKKIEQQNAIIQEQRQTQAQTNVILEQIKTNTNKMPEQTQPSQPVVQPTPSIPTPPIIEPYFDKSRVTLVGDYQLTTDSRGFDKVYKIKPGNVYTIKVEFLNNLGQPMAQGKQMKMTNSVNSEEVTKTTGDFTEYEFTAPQTAKGYERIYFSVESYQATLAFILE